MNNKTNITPGMYIGASKDPARLEQMMSDMTLIAEAATVTNECGKTPRELLELVRELRGDLNKIESAIHCLDPLGADIAIAKARNFTVDALEKTKNL